MRSLFSTTTITFILFLAIPSFVTAQLGVQQLRHPLEKFDLALLRFIGTLDTEKTSYAVIIDPTGMPHRVTVNDFIGRNYGKVEEVTEDHLDLIEIIPDGYGGWQESPQTLWIWGKEGANSYRDLVPDAYDLLSTALSPPDAHIRDELEYFNLRDLRIKGTIEKGGKRYLVVLPPSGEPYYTTTGNYVGRNYGKIMAASDREVEITEIIGDGFGGWEERPRIIPATNQPRAWVLEAIAYHFIRAAWAGDVSNMRRLSKIYGTVLTNALSRSELLAYAITANAIMAPFAVESPPGRVFFAASANELNEADDLAAWLEHSMNSNDEGFYADPLLQTSTFSSRTLINPSNSGAYDRLRDLNSALALLAIESQIQYYRAVLSAVGLALCDGNPITASLAGVRRVRTPQWVDGAGRLATNFRQAIRQYERIIELYGRITADFNERSGACQHG